jgi:hypothetical protein
MDITSTAAEAAEAYNMWMEAHPPERLSAKLNAIRGRHLAWCPLDQPCHVDVLLRLANQPREAGT